jgi:hypothetical protein
VQGVIIEAIKDDNSLASSNIQVMRVSYTSIERSWVIQAGDRDWDMVSHDQTESVRRADSSCSDGVTVILALLSLYAVRRRYRVDSSLACFL